jgi:hypothetical protein
MIKVIVVSEPFSIISLTAMTRENKKYKSHLSKYFAWWYYCWDMTDCDWHLAVLETYRDRGG